MKPGPLAGALPALRYLALSGVLLLGAAATTAAPGGDPLARAQALLAAGDFEHAYPLYLEQADAGDNALAMFGVALFFEFGWGRPVDRRSACLWFERAAERQIPAAEHFTGDCLRHGVHRARAPAAAARWYERAAAHGHLTSLCSLAELLIAGDTAIARDVPKGMALCLSAAQRGLKPAQVRLARFHLEGVTGTPDYAAAQQILSVAAAADYPEAQYLLAGLYRDGLGRPADPDVALNWFEQAASHGYLPAYAPTARLYWQMPRDPDSGLLPAPVLAKAYLWALAWLRRAGDAADVAAARALVGEIGEELPESWVADLTRKVDQHLAAVAATPAGTRLP